MVFFFLIRSFEDCVRLNNEFSMSAKNSIRADGRTIISNDFETACEIYYF